MTNKNLSVNSDCLPPADQRSGEGEQGSIAGFGFLKAHQQFAKAIEP